MPKSFWTKLPGSLTRIDSPLLMLPMIVNVCGRSLMDEWQFPLFGELCAPMDNKNKPNDMIALQRRGGRAGSNQSKVCKAPN